MLSAHVAFPDEAESLGPVLARAFQDDPVMRWLFPDDAERRMRLTRLFTNSVARVNRGRRLIYSVGSVEIGDEAASTVSAALWDPPGTWRMSIWDQLRLAPAMLSTFGRRILLVLKMMTELEHHHLAEPHYYLFAIGTDPPLQRHGAGSALMSPILERCDREGLPAFLESSNPRNLSFYRRFGFEVTGALTLPSGGPSLDLMRRAPR
jgi:ribosomal protein S18 acetylase RimI-like enzyme